MLPSVSKSSCFRTKGIRFQPAKFGMHEKTIKNFMIIIPQATLNYLFIEPRRENPGIHAKSRASLSICEAYDKPGQHGPTDGVSAGRVEAPPGHIAKQ